MAPGNQSLYMPLSLKISGIIKHPSHRVRFRSGCASAFVCGCVRLNECVVPWVCVCVGGEGCDRD